MAEVKLVIKQIDQGSQNIKQTDERLKGMLKTVGLVSAGLVAAGVAARKAFDLSKEGANIDQLTSSFELMNAQVFQTPDLLDKMSAAARGTIKETDLMAGLLKLTAGASNELAQNLASNAPQLLEIAKAANKLNPSLGDTAFLYDSIATGIKRSSPLILDNLGIVVKVGEANERYAAELGKTVEALTAEEKQIALLNEVLRSGDTLIQQVGGSVDSQADSWARLEVKIGTATDKGKQFLAQVLLPLIDLLAEDTDPLTENFIDANQLAAQAKSFEEFIGLLEEYNVHVPDSSTARAWFDQAQAIKETAAASEELADKFTQQQNATSGMSAATRDAAEAASSFDRALLQNFATVQDAINADRQLTEAFRELDEAAGAYFEDAIEGDLTQGNLNQKMFDAAAAAGASATELALLGGALGLYSDEAVEAALKTAIIQVEIDRLAQAYANGDLTVGQMTAQLNNFIAGLDATSGSVNHAGQEIDALISKINNIPTSHTFVVKVEQDGALPSLPSGPAGTGAAGAFALGGFLRPGEVSQVGEFNLPELFTQGGKLFMIPGDQGQVFSNSQSQGMMGGNTTLNAPITINVQGGGDPQAISAAVQDALLRSMRTVGVQ